MQEFAPVVNQRARSKTFAHNRHFISVRPFSGSAIIVADNQRLSATLKPALRMIGIFQTFRARQRRSTFFESDRTVLRRMTPVTNVNGHQLPKHHQAKASASLPLTTNQYGLAFKRLALRSCSKDRHPD